MAKTYGASTGSGSVEFANGFTLNFYDIERIITATSAIEAPRIPMPESDANSNDGAEFIA